MDRSRQTDPSAERRENIGRLENNYTKLMQQNTKLEEEIKHMNAQFTLRQNQRLDAMRPILNPSPSLNQAPYEAGSNDVSQSTVQANMESSFDERCARTKQIVTQLAKRLHAAK